MSREMMIKRKRQMRRIQRNRRAAALCMALIAVFSASILFHNFGAQAQKPDTYKYYTEIRVDRDDTLWDIALEYMTEEYKSPQEYIREVKEINHLGMELQYGQYLTIPYYSEEYKI